MQGGKGENFLKIFLLPVKKSFTIIKKIQY